MPDGTGEQTSAALSRVGDLIWKAIPAIGSAIGFVGFIAVIGAALQWLRFNAAGLPATQALLAIPRQELVITGSWALSLAVLAGLVASLVVYLFDSRGDANNKTARGIVLVATIEIATSAYLTKLTDGKLILFFAWTLVLGLALLCFGEALTPHFTRRRKLTRLRRAILETREELASASDSPQSKEAYDAASRRLKRTVQEWRETGKALAWPDRKKDVEAAMEAAEKAVESVPQADTTQATKTEPNLPPTNAELGPLLARAEAQLGGSFTATREWFYELPGEALSRLRKCKDEGLYRPKPNNGDKEVQVTRLPGLLATGIALGVGLILAIVTSSAFLFSWLSYSVGRWTLLVSIAAVLLATTNMFIAHGTEKFLWYGVSVFFSVVVFGAIMEMANTVHYPSVQPVAILRKENATGICGVFVTQTSERVYVGRLPLRNLRPGLIFWVPTADVEMVSIGRSQEIHSKTIAYLQTNESDLLRRLYLDRAEEAPAEVKDPTSSTVEGIAGTHSRQTTDTAETPARKYTSTPRQAPTVQGACESSLDPRPVHKKLLPLAGT